MSLRDSAFREAFAAAKTCYRAGDLQAAFSQLERAHVLGQSQLGRHWAVHVWMLRIGWRQGDPSEVAGQLLRLVCLAARSAGPADAADRGRQVKDSERFAPSALI